jgi:subtilisin family serine protease
MRWGIAVHILLFALNLLPAQTYVVKYRSGPVDTTALRSIIVNAFPSAKSTASAPLSITVSPLARTIPRTATDFPWNRYAVLHVSIPLTAAVLQSLGQNSPIEYIQLNHRYKVYSVPNDSAFDRQWNLQRIGITSLLSDGTISSSLPRVKVGIIDTGIDETHPDLADAIATNSGEYGNGKESNGIDDDLNGFIDDWRGYDFVELEAADAGDWHDRDNDPHDENGHGTAVAGIIGAHTNNGVGIAGIAPAAIVPLRAFGKNGNGSDIDIASAIIYAADNGVDVINMSFGDVVRSTFLQDAIRYAYGKNVVLVASSGNDGSSAPHYPSDFSEVISTGSVGQYDIRSFFSSYSPSLDIMAPGEQIATTTLGGGYTDQFAGTSAAAPHVAGIAAVLKSIGKKKALNDPAYHMFTNEEIRGILLNTADDAGPAGWDAQYGAGVVNAKNALIAATGSVVIIHSPGLDEHCSSNSIPVVVTALGPYLSTVSLYAGAGDEPVKWELLSTHAARYFSRDTLFVWNISAKSAGTYILRLVAANSKGEDQEFRQRLTIDRTDPRIAAFRYRDSVLIGGLFGTLVEARTDRNTTGTLYYRRSGDTEYRSIRSAGIQKNHSFLVSQKDADPLVRYEYFCEFTENSLTRNKVRFPTVVLAGTDHFSFTLPSRTIPTAGFDKKSYSLPKGYLLNSVVHINGSPVVILNEYTDEDEFGSLKAFTFNGNSFLLKDSTTRSWVPRDFQSGTANGKPGILVQEHGISQLLLTDSLTGKFFSNPVWGDSTDVWASALNDLDGDAVPEVIARSSSEYLVYKKNGSTYTVAARLPNPSTPLVGDAKNQFGPPRSVTGSFTGAGVKEIVFADYDGDLLMYRQAAPQSLSFVFAGIDSSELFEMSDYIVSGDFTGDGIEEFAVAGHSNLDWNTDREYDAPVWTVKVYSHRPADPAGKMSLLWQQHFAGVKAGSGYDNGLSAGSLKTSDTKKALIISLNPSLYVAVWNASLQSFEFVWKHQSQSNNAIVYDFDKDGMNDIGFNTNGRTEFWSLPGISVPVPPYAVTARPLSGTSVRISWNSPALRHNIYRGGHPDSLQLLAAIDTLLQYQDKALITGRRYFYSVTAVDGSESHRSSIIATIPHTALTITSVSQQSMYQLTLGFSFDVGSDRMQSAEFILDSVIRPASIVWISSRKALVTFKDAIEPGAHGIRIGHLIDNEGMEADTSQSFHFNTVDQEQERFFVRTLSLVSVNRIKIEFNAPIDHAVSDKPSYYSVRTSVRSYSTGAVDSLGPSSVLLTVPGTDLTRLAVRIDVSISDSVRSTGGIRLNSAAGQVVSIAQETHSLDRIVVYPNPVKQAQRVSFVNIPANCRITIFSPAGERIRTLSDRASNEGVSWDLRTDSGILVSTGIYLYRVEQLNDANETGNTIMGKFAVIR